MVLFVQNATHDSLEEANTLPLLYLYFVTDYMSTLQLHLNQTNYIVTHLTTGTMVTVVPANTRDYRHCPPQH